MAKRAKAFTEHFPTEFDSPESKLISRASYDVSGSLLTIHFAAGTTYLYGPFPPKLWLEFEQAASKGNYFNKIIRPMFAGKPVEA